MTGLVELLADLAVEGDRLRATVAGLADAAWRLATPAIGWDVATQIAHLACSDEVALLAVRAAGGDGGGWDAVLSRVARDPLHFVDTAAIAGASEPAAAIPFRAGIPPGPTSTWRCAGYRGGCRGSGHRCRRRRWRRHG